MSQTCNCCGGDLPDKDIWECNRNHADDCTGSVDANGRCRAFSRDELWEAEEEAETRECRCCGRDLPVAEDETDPDVDFDECVLDAQGIVAANYYVCGQCISEALLSD